MGKINILDKHVAELIAAGEVVERPSSVIKELLENSIDAGATIVTIEIKNGGTTYMKITDNGCGILKEDIKNAFLRHATSKVKNQDDLDSILTLGFRGEALASICAVSRVELITRTEKDIAGTRYLINGGEEVSCEDIGCPQGSTIIIRDIFYNIPARMKFLKTDLAESNAIAAIVDRIALSHPEISFKFIRDNKECLNTPGNNDIKSAIYSIYGKDFSSSLIPLNYELNGVKVHGFISSLQATRANRSMQHFFINGRYVKTKTAMVALEQAFKGSIMVGKFPSCVLYIEVSCEAVDVNVHPAKIEVRFINEKPIFDAVYYGTKSALNANHDISEMVLSNDNNDKAIEKLKIQNNEPEISKESSFEKIEKENVNKDPVDNDPQVFIPRKPSSFHLKLNDNNSSLNENYLGKKEENDNYKKVESDYLKEFIKKEDNFNSIKVDKSEEQPSILKKDEIKVTNKIIGEAFSTYIIVEKNNDELILIDKHAANERMIYEKLKSEDQKSNSQLLLKPITITLDKLEYNAILENLSLMSELGFEIGDFGMGTVLVRSVPMYLEKTDVNDTIIEIAGYLTENKIDINTNHLDWLYHNIACRAAIKAGTKSNYEELLDLVKKLESNKDIKCCPHGRPVSISIKKENIEKQFGRT